MWVAIDAPPVGWQILPNLILSLAVLNSMQLSFALYPSIVTLELQVQFN